MKVSYRNGEYLWFWGIGVVLEIVVFGKCKIVLSIFYLWKKEENYNSKCLDIFLVVEEDV